MATNKPEPGSITNPLKFRNQDYDSLRDACLKSGTLYSDPLFPVEESSIGMPLDPDPKKAVTWRRPKEISTNAMFIEDTTCTTDICQGQLGNCWLLAALSSLTQHPILFAKVVPPGQSMTDSYAGIFHFRFWQYGEWVDVVIDDRLPVRNGRLLFSYSRTLNEFWSALVEKAYAKMTGSYGSLKGGNISEGMEDFTGGIARSLPISSRAPRVLWKALTASLSRGTLLSCFIQAANLSEIGTVNAQGLVKGHAYAITDTDQVHKKTGDVFLLRLRNPWGFVEYCGPWSDKCTDWEEVDSAEKQRIELIKAEDGEFWINVEDFSALFNTVELCSVNPDSLIEEEVEGQESHPSAWAISSYQGSWVPGCSAGGNIKTVRTFWKNPQFRLLLTEREDDGDEDEGDDGDEVGEGAGAGPGAAALAQPVVPKQKDKGLKCSVVVEVLQKHRRQKDKINFLSIAFHIYRIPPELADKPEPLGQAFFSSRRPVTRSGKYQALRGIRRKVRLEPGYYVIVASTYRSNQQGEFFLRTFTKAGNTLGDQDFPCSVKTLMAVPSKPVTPKDQKRIRELFDKEAGADERLDAVELMKLLDSLLEKKHQLPMETCRQLIFGEDTGGRCRLTLPQTERILSSLRSLQSIFNKYDEDSSGTMSPFDLSLALQAAGLQCDGPVLQTLWERVGSGELQLPFHGFVSCVVRLRVLLALYESESSPETKERGVNVWLLKFLAV